MLFSSLVFLFVFLPLILVVYYSVPRAGKNVVLFVFSILFYAWGGVSFTIVLLFSILLNYIFARQLSKHSKNHKRWLYFGIGFNLLLLGTFKYLVFFVDLINDVSWLVSDSYKPFDDLKILLPLGISFFTFQQMSMLWDIYREKKSSKIRFLDTALYIGFFPQLIAGPIVRYHDIIDQIKKRTESIDLINSGITRFILGLFKKVVLANTCAMVADPIMALDATTLSTPAAWLGIAAYTLQLYFDFSGYSDMAIGLGRMFGFRILENFNFPYISKSVIEFWRRWHISLSSWIRDYLYFPLGGSKRSAGRTYFNLVLVFVLTGFWHGATWNFIVFGFFHGFFILIEKAYFSKVLTKLPSLITIPYAVGVFLLSLVLFKLDDLPTAGTYYMSLLGSNTGEVSALSYLDPEKIGIMLLALVSCFPIKTYLKSKIQFSFSSSSAAIIVQNFGLLLLFFYSVMLVNSNSYNPFIYFRF